MTWVSSHDGVDIDDFKPVDRNHGHPCQAPVCPSPGLTENAAIVTDTAPGLEPCRGFPQFLQGIAIIQQRRPEVHAIIVGSGRVYYSPRPWCSPVAADGFAEASGGRGRCTRRRPPELYQPLIRKVSNRSG
jgi:glycosyltransferase involved in cell wall biosynthesis